MKKLITILVVMALMVAFTSTAQIQRGKKPAQSKTKTEQTSKKKATSSSNSSSSNRAGGQNQTKKRVINQAICDMVLVSGGTFTMGGTSEQGGYVINDEKPTHQVTLTSFYISKYEVTQELWIAVMGSNPSHFKSDLKRPVECVTWEDCQKFITKLNNLTGKEFRLPTEAEWEYSARGGNKSNGYMYAGSDNPNVVAWNSDNSGRKTHPVGTKSPNELGLYDMSGNVWEWCQDWKDYYSSDPQTNPAGPSTGYCRVFRGGAWNHRPTSARVSSRYEFGPTESYNGLGFRLAASSL